MQNKTQVLAFFVLVGVVLGGVAWWTHTHPTGGGAGNGVRTARKAPPLPDVAVMPQVAAEAPVKPKVSTGSGTSRVGASFAAGTALSPAPTVTPVRAPVTPQSPSLGEVDGVKVVPVSSSLNATGSDPRLERKSLIPGPDEVGVSVTEGAK